jgi:hypothetical protein
MKKAIFILSAILILASCKKESEDSTKPQINSVKINGIVADEHEMNAGETFTIEVSTSDNESLNQLKVNIHSADDGHTHDEASGEVDAPNIGVWSETQIFNISGTSNTQSLTLDIPAVVAGHWHVEVMLIDEQGNEALEYVTTLHVVNTNLPIMNVVSVPAAVDYEISIAPGETITLTGTITDDDGLDSGHVELENETTGEIVWEQNLTGVSGTSFDLGSILVGPIIDAGHYHLRIHMIDADGYTGEWAVEVHVE